MLGLVLEAPPVVVEAPAAVGPVEQVLVAARDRVKAGWCKGRAKKTDAAGNDSYCVTGAIFADNYSLSQKRALQLFADGVGVSPNAVPDWNDVFFRTKGRVLRAFDRAIAAANVKGI